MPHAWQPLANDLSVALKDIDNLLSRNRIFIDRTMDLLRTMALLAFPELCWRERAA